jgi:hypothetical protein
LFIETIPQEATVGTSIHPHRGLTIKNKGSKRILRSEMTYEHEK